MNNQKETKPLVDRRREAEAVCERADNEMPDDSAEGTGNGAGGGGRLTTAQDLERYVRLRSQMQHTIGVLQTRLIAEYQTMTRCRSVPSESGRIDGRRLHRAVAGDPAVFRHKVKKEIPKPAVSLTLDVSGSMNGDRLDLAIQAVIALMEANANICVPTEVSVFGGHGHKVVKTFDQSVAAVRPKIGGLAANGGTPTEIGLYWAGVRLAQRREQRRLLLLVTDGEPNSVSRTQRVADMVMRSGIELYGIGIMTGAVARFCPHYGVVKAPEEIGAAILTAVRSRICNARAA